MKNTFPFLKAGLCLVMAALPVYFTAAQPIAQAEHRSENARPDPGNPGDWRCGLDTYDLVLIAKHILGSQPLDSPYKIIAADADHSKSVTTADLVELRKLILHIYESLPKNTSWRFIPASYVFPDPADPWAEDFPKCIAVDMTNQTEAQDQDFIAIKVGDVNLSATTGCGNAPPLAGAAAGRAADAVQLQGVAGPVAEGEKAEVEVWVESPADLVAWQAGLWFDTGYLELESVAAGALDYMTPAISERRKKKPANCGCFGTPKTPGRCRTAGLGRPSSCISASSERLMIGQRCCG